MILQDILTNNLEYKEGYLPIALYKNAMVSKDNNESYYARIISRGTCTVEDLAVDLTKAGLDFGLTSSQLIEIAKAFNGAKIARMREGFIVDDGFTRASAKIEGSFFSENDTYSPQRHSIGMGVRPSAAVKKLFNELQPVIRQGNSSSPTITGVHDLESQGGAVLTKGGFLEVTGTKIMVTGTHGDVGLYLENIGSPDKTVKIPIEKLGTNTSTRLACVIPSTLEAGKYKVKVTTQYVGSKTLRKEPLSFTYDTEYTVA